MDQYITWPYSKNREISSLELVEKIFTATQKYVNVATPRCGMIYLLRDQVGKGTFGKMFKVVDVSTGTQHAGKSFYQSECDPI